MNTDSIVKALMERQAREGWSYRTVAREVGVHHTTWYFIAHGERGPGMTFIKRVLARFPEFTPLLFLPAGVSHNHGSVSSDQQEAA